MGSKQRAEYNTLKAQAGASNAAREEERQKKKREHRGLEPTLITLQTRVQELTAEQSTVESKVSALEERKASGTDKAKEVGAQLKALEAESKALTAETKGNREKRTTLEARLADVVGQLRSSKAEYRESERERKSGEAIENLIKHFPGVHGRISDICKPSQKKYQVPVTIAMGKNMDAVVVENGKTAMEAIAYLNEKKCPPETFIPLDTIRAKPVREGLRQLGGSKVPCQDVITAPEKYVKAVQFAVGDAVICDDMDEARQLAYHSRGSERFKVVTLDGTLINKAGLITGGSSPQEKARANKWNQREHEQLKKHQKEITTELEALGPLNLAEERDLALRYQVGSKQSEVAAVQADLEVTKAKLGKHTKELKAIAPSLKAAQSEWDKADAQLKSLASEMAEMQAGMDAVEDKIFAKFSKALGVASVREYEERSIKVAREREAKLLALKTTQSKLKAQLLYEKRRDMPAAVAKVRASIDEDEKTIAKKLEKQAKVTKASEGLKELAEKAEEEAKEVKEAQEKLVSDLKGVRKELKASLEKTAAAKGKLGQIEGEISKHRSHRQSYFNRARMEEVSLPTVAAGVDMPDAASVARAGGGDAAGGEQRGGEQRGGGKAGKRKRGAAGDSGAAGSSSYLAAELMASETFSPSALIGTGTFEGGGSADEDEDVEMEDTDGGGTSGGRGGRGGGSNDVTALEELVRVDFSTLDEQSRSAEPSEYEPELKGQIDDVSSQIEGMAPNMKALVQYEEVQQRLHLVETDYEESRSAAKTIAQQFAAIQAKRYGRYMGCFKHISESIDDIYKDLTQVEGVPLGGTAYLSLEDPSEPYLHGTKYTAMPAGKRFRDMDQLSGGERTVAALALLFAGHKYRPSPFFVMDEIDAALDNVNVTRVAQYIREKANEGSMQFVVISLKDNFYHKAHGLVGVFRDRREEASNCATLDLEALDAPDDAVAEDDMR